MSSRPLSFYATPGASAFGSLGQLPPDHDEFPGLTMAEYVRLPCSRLLEPKTFVHGEFLNNKWGDTPEVQAFLVLAILYEPEKPEAVIVWGFWASDIDGENSSMALSYDLKGIFKGDPLSGETVKKMDDKEQVFDVNWPGKLALNSIDPSIKVHARYAAYHARDVDNVALSAVVHSVKYGKRKSYVRIEPLPDDDTFTIDMLVDLVPKPAWLKFPDKRCGPSGVRADALGQIGERFPLFEQADLVEVAEIVFVFVREHVRVVRLEGDARRPRFSRRV